MKEFQPPNISHRYARSKISYIQTQQNIAFILIDFRNK